ncbi:MAG: type II toxin-antitoxin system Phd/YefM family antitoxin [Betaproteobacteria bacterium]
MDANVRDLKAQLSSYLRRVAQGESITVRVRKRAVARIVPVRPADQPADLARIPGVRWNGRKPRGLASGERVPRGMSLASWVARNRR